MTSPAQLALLSVEPPALPGIDLRLCSVDSNSFALLGRCLSSTQTAARGWSSGGVHFNRMMR